MANSFPVDVPDADLWLTSLGVGALGRIESGASSAGPWTELTTFALVAGTYAYVVSDPAGTASTWYRRRYSTATPTLPAHYSAYATAFLAPQNGDLCTVAEIKADASIDDAVDDATIAGLIRSVSMAMEREAGTYLAPRASQTVYFDGNGRTEIRFAKGVSSISYLGVAYSDQPDDGSGTYAAITSGIYLDPPAHERDHETAPAYTIVLGSTTGTTFPPGRRTVKMTADLGPSATAPREARTARNAIVRALAANGTSGAGYVNGVDVAIVGPDGGMRILRDFAPSELAETHNSYRIGLS
jgi:hypothetical protein